MQRDLSRSAARRRRLMPRPAVRPEQLIRDMAWTERSITQWALMEALAFAERAGIVICGFLFLFSDFRDFWTFWGLFFVVANVVFLAPVFGILVFMTERLAYRARKWIKKPVISMGELKWLGRAVHFFWLPLMVMGTYTFFDIYDRLAPVTGPLDFWRSLFT